LLEPVSSRFEELGNLVDFLRGLGRDGRGYSLSTSQFGHILDFRLAAFDLGGLRGAII